MTVEQPRNASGTACGGIGIMKPLDVLKQHIRLALTRRSLRVLLDQYRRAPGTSGRSLPDGGAAAIGGLTPPERTGLAITTYNRPEYLSQFISSLLETDHRLLGHVCVIDDNSDMEETRGLLERFKALDVNHVSVFKTARNVRNHVTLPLALDYLLSQGCSTLINVDADCIFKPNWLSVLLELHKQFPNDIVTGFNSPKHPAASTSAAHYIKNTIGGVNLVFGALTYAEAVRGSFASKSRWDWEMCARAKSSHRLLVASRPSVVQHIGIESSLRHKYADRAEDFE